MTERQRGDQRREQIVAATLALLADTSVSQLTTRQIAKTLNLSQPALFRHFASRDALLLAVVAHTRDQLAGIAHQVLACQQAPPAAIHLLVRGLFDFAQAHPGLPRLLFHDAEASSPLRAPLAQLVAMQVALVSALVRGHQERGAVPPEVHPERAARLLVATVQGSLLQARDATIELEPDALVDAWWAALCAGLPAGSSVSVTASDSLLHLALADILAQGRDPLTDVLAAVDRLRPDGLLHLSVPFRPTPLITLLGQRGLRVTDHPCHDQHLVLARMPQAPEVVDLRDLPVPEPLKAILEASAQLAPSQRYLARTPRLPRLLLERLSQRGLSWQAAEDPDGAAVIAIWSGQ